MKLHRNCEMFGQWPGVWCGRIRGTISGIPTCLKLFQAFPHFFVTLWVLKLTEVDTRGRVLKSTKANIHGLSAGTWVFVNKSPRILTLFRHVMGTGYFGPGKQQKNLFSTERGKDYIPNRGTISAIVHSVSAILMK